MIRKILLFSVAIICLALLLPIIAQNKSDDLLPIEKAIESKQFKKADSLFNQDVTKFLSVGNVDTLAYYVTFKGEISEGLLGAEKSSAPVFAFIDFLKSKKASQLSLVKAYRNAAEFFANTGQDQHGYEASQGALTHTMLQPDRDDLEIARCEYNLGVYSYRLGNFNLSEAHHRRAMDIRLKNKNTEPEAIYFSANAIGTIMWAASKYDSTAYFFNMALDALKRAPETDINKYFRPGNVESNLSTLYSAQGKTTEAIKAMESAIDNFQKFIASEKPHPKKQSAMEGVFEGMDNLAGFYKEIGDYGKAGDLLRYSYQQKLKNLNPGHTGIFISEVLLGQHYYAVHEYDSAMHYLTMGLNKIEKADGDYLFWAADANHTLALIYENKKDKAKAAEAYAKSELLYEESYQGKYDNSYMDFLRHASLFYANYNEYSKAIERANKVYKYLLTVGEGASLQAFYQLLNIAEINYLTKRYQQAIQFSNSALNTVNAKMKDGITLLDSVKMEVFKPKAILIQAKSEYALHQKKDTVFLQSLSLKLKDALSLLEKRKVLIDDATSINILIADNQELIDFAKKTELDLYEITGQSKHLDQFINLHESALYTRIRSRLDKEKAIQFSQLPLSVQKEEQELKAAIPNSLQADKAHSELMNNYVQAVSKWETHLNKIKKDYPAYYTMRYATLFKPLQQLQSSLTDSITVVRYIQTDSSFVALVIDRTNKKMVRINKEGIEEEITALLSNTATEKDQLSILHYLYQKLWQPIEPFIRGKRVTIIPDGILYNLSFEMLSKKPVAQYSNLLSTSLLSNYLLSYHYSLFMLDHKKTDNAWNKNYVAFAPGFSDEIKSKYRSAVNDSSKLDYHYLNLLPQPFTNKLAYKVSSLVNGEIYLEEKSTQDAFRKNADGHKIIHIGTHAEYNNVHPEQSGLIFAKNTSVINDTNFLSLYNIYNCKMHSALTVLTACESGRPGYQDGEGMVSLAHAFNYAGSQSILTALWKIDEQSTATIMDGFYSNLLKGMPKDEALQQAKLSYLAQSGGRTLAPQYWAGLVLIGDTTSINIEKRRDWTWMWLLGGLVLLSIGFFSVYQRKRLNSKRA
jgi:CHAT domain-containing protein